MDNLTRLIGPIPASYCSPVEEGVFAHPGGPAPAWGGYSPLQVDVPLSWLSPEIQDLVTQPGTCWGSEGQSLRGTLFQAHTTDTLLVLAADGWYVAAPARPCRRAIVIGLDALRAGAPLPSGLLDIERAEAERIQAAGGQGYSARLAWDPEPEPWPTEPGSDEDVTVFVRREEE